MSNALVMKGGDPNLGELNVGTSNAAHAEQLSKAVGAPKSIRNKISNAAASLKSGASKLGKWISNTWMGRNAAGNSRWTRYGRKFMGRNAAGNFSLNPPRKIPRAAPAAVAAAAAAVKKRKIISTNIFTNVVQIFIG